MSTTIAPPRHVARWEALGCTIHLETRQAIDLDPARRLVTQVLSDVDAVASRFRDDSELALVNENPGRWVRVDTLLVAALRVALKAAHDSDGLVHPLLGRPMVELGYDRTFGLLREVTVPVGDQSPAPPLDSWRDVELDEDAVRIPDGTSLDLGATAKAWCTDLAVTALEEHLSDDAVVSIGGDLRTAGTGSWEVAVSERPGDEPQVMIELTGALATSSTQVRRWRRAGVERHHILDPRTGAPAREVWRTVSVAAATCAEANTASTAAIVLGVDAAEHLSRTVAAARLVDTTGRIQLIGAWPALPLKEGQR